MTQRETRWTVIKVFINIHYQFYILSVISVGTGPFSLSTKSCKCSTINQKCKVASIYAHYFILTCNLPRANCINYTHYAMGRRNGHLLIYSVLYYCIIVINTLRGPFRRRLTITNSVYWVNQLLSLNAFPELKKHQCSHFHRKIFAMCTYYLHA